jgi:glycosyltransferase involved in cell wall biosynthesis
MPCLNEEAAIGPAVESLLDGFFLQNGEMLVVDGGSTDRTREIVAGFGAKYPIRLLENPNKLQAHGLNVGIREAKGRFIIRADAHCLYPKDYLRRCVEMLGRDEVVNAGGVMFPEGRTPMQQGIAYAMRHPVGVGDARFHLGKYSGYAEGAYVGAFKREIFDLVGLYDPEAHPNEDSELNIRIVKSGRKIWLDGSLKVAYFPRRSLGKLFRQFFRYGRGRCYTTLKHKTFTSPRQLGPTFLVPALSASLVVAIFHPVWLAVPASYLLGVFAAAMAWPAKPVPPFRVRFLSFPAFVTMHIAWGIGFLSRLLGFR